MKYLANMTEMKEIDRRCIHEYGIPSLALMERAGYSVFDEIGARFPSSTEILVVSAMGNNGADGLVTARYLANAGYPVSILPAGTEDHASQEMKVQLDIVRKMGIPFTTMIGKQKVIVDALFGIGLCKPVAGAYADLIVAMNAADAFRVAVDVPSGVHSTTGEVMGVAVMADLTVTFGVNKRGLVFHPGTVHAGEVAVREIGFLNRVLREIPFGTITYDEEDLKRIPKRKPHSNKGSYGKLAVIAGSTGQAGAAFLAATAAYRTGCGLVRIVTPESNRPVLQELLPEAIMTTYEDFEDNLFRDVLVNSTHVAIGPGLSVSYLAKSVLDFIVEETDVPMVIDADGINLLEEHQMKVLSGRPVILTPHVLEMKRLCKRLNFPWENDPVELAKHFVSRYNMVLVLKDSRTVVAMPDRPVYVNLSGNNALAKGGSGDVLTGIIGGLLSTGAEPFEAAKLGVYIHGLCGQIASEKHSMYSTLARDIIDGLDTVMR